MATKKDKSNERQEIIAQALREIQFARTYKQGKTRNWQLNEDMYYGKKLNFETSRANVDLGRMQEFVHTLLSKIDNPLTFKYTKRKNSQLKRVARLNALRQADADEGNWDIKDLVGKKQGTIYGRVINSAYGESDPEYCFHNDNVDVYEFLIDPAAGGIDIEKARYLGDYGVVYDRTDIEAGIKAGIFLKEEGKTLLDGSGNASEQTQETTNQNNRTAAQNTTLITKQISDADKFKFWRWGTTYKGKRYYLLLSERGGTALRVDPIEEVFLSGLWWYWTYAVFPDLTEFWTPSYCDYVREIFMAQGISINQALDNAEQINKPQKVVNVNAIENMADLKYVRGGNNIRVKGDFDANKAVQILNTPSIDTPFKVFEILEGIQEKSSGVTAGAKGVADPDGKATIYAGNAANTADRFGLLNKSYSFGYKRLAKLYEWAVREHLTKKKAVDIIGPDGVEQEMISRRDIFHKDDTFGVLVEASNAELALSEQDKNAKMAFLTAETDTPGPEQAIINPKKAFEMKARIVGFEEDEIRQLLDTSEFGDADLMSEADRDIEEILDGKKIKPNQNANTAYMQRFIDWLRDHQEDITPEKANEFFAYIDSLDEIVIRNMTRQAQQTALQMKLAAIKAAAAAPPVPGKPSPALAPLGPSLQPDAPPVTEPIAPPAPEAPAAPPDMGGSPAAGIPIS